MTSKMISAAVAALCGVTLLATPSTNTLDAVKADWYEGRFTNVYELAQSRLAANSNDLVAAHLMMEWDLAFSGREALSNSIMRLVRVSDEATLPAFTNLYRVTRSGWMRYVNTYLPSVSDEELEMHHQRSLQNHRPMNSDILLEVLDENGLWNPAN